MPSNWMKEWRNEILRQIAFLIVPLLLFTWALRAFAADPHDEWYDYIVEQTGFPPVVYEVHGPPAMKPDITYLHDEGGGEVTDRIGVIITRQVDLFLANESERASAGKDLYLYGEWRVVVRNAERGELPKRWPKEYASVKRKFDRKEMFRQEDCIEEYDCENCDEDQLCWFCCENGYANDEN